MVIGQEGGVRTLIAGVTSREPSRLTDFLARGEGVEPSLRDSESRCLPLTPSNEGRPLASHPGLERMPYGDSSRAKALSVSQWTEKESNLHLAGFNRALDRRAASPSLPRRPVLPGVPSGAVPSACVASVGTRSGQGRSRTYRLRVWNPCGRRDLSPKLDEHAHRGNALFTGAQCARHPRSGWRDSNPRCSLPKRPCCR